MDSKLLTFASVTFHKMISEIEKNGSDGSATFLERLLEVSKNNPQFTREDISAETATILTGVRRIQMNSTILA